jgi:hypothetical protein
LLNGVVLGIFNCQHTFAHISNTDKLTTNKVTSQ